MPVRFETGDVNKIHPERWLRVNNFFGLYLETIAISRKDDLKTIVHLRPSCNIAVYMRSIMEGMRANHLRIIERDVLFNKTMVTGPDVHHRLNANDPFTLYQHLMNRRNKFAYILDGEENYVPGRVMQTNNLIWRDNKHVIPIRLLAPFCTIKSEISMNLIIKFNTEQDIKKLFEAIIADGGEEVDRRPGQKGRVLRCV